MRVVIASPHVSLKSPAPVISEPADLLDIVVIPSSESFAGITLDVTSVQIFPLQIQL